MRRLLDRLGWIGDDGVIGGNVVDQTSPFVGRDKVQHLVSAWISTVIVWKLVALGLDGWLARVVAVGIVQLGGIAVECIEDMRLDAGETFFADTFDPRDLVTNLVGSLLAIPVTL